MFDITNTESGKNIVSNRKLIPLTKEKGGFNYKREIEQDELDDSTIYNLLIKSRLFRAIDIKRDWIDVSLTEKNGDFFVVLLDKRVNNPQPQVIQLNDSADYKIVRFAKEILFPQKALTDIEFRKGLKSVAIDVFSDLDLNVDSFKENKSLIRLEFNITNPMSIELFISTNQDRIDGTYLAGFELFAPNGEKYIKELFKVKDIEDFKQEIKNVLPTIKSEIKSVLNTVSTEELITPKKNRNRLYL